MKEGSDDAAKVEELTGEVKELKDKLIRWKEQSKVGIEQHRNRIKELTAKLGVSNAQNNELFRLSEAVANHFRATSQIALDSSAEHLMLAVASAVGAARSLANRLVAQRDVLLQAASDSTTRERVERHREKESLDQKLRDLEQELQKISSQKIQLEEKLKITTSKENLRESAATRDAVALAVAAVREDFEAEELSLRIQYENEISQLKLLHEMEMNKLVEENEERLEAARQEVMFAPQQERIVTDSPTAGCSSNMGTQEKDDSYLLLLETNQRLEMALASLRKDNKRLLEEVALSSNSKIVSGGPKTQYTPLLPAASGMPTTLAEAQTMLIEVQGREQKLRGELCDLQLQLGALKEHPPLPDGAMSAEQVQYLKALILKLYTEKDRNLMLAKLAPEARNNVPEITWRTIKNDSPHEDNLVDFYYNNEAVELHWDCSSLV
eukprot:gene4416-3215_t